MKSIEMANQEHEPTGQFVSIRGRTYKVCCVNFQGVNKLWSVSFFTQSGHIDTGWFHRNQFTDTPTPEKVSLRQGC
jgi:hypothetical protein